MIAWVSFLASTLHSFRLFSLICRFGFICNLSVRTLLFGLRCKLLAQMEIVQPFGSFANNGAVVLQLVRLIVVVLVVLRDVLCFEKAPRALMIRWRMETQLFWNSPNL